MLKLDEVTNPLRENERMMRNENSDNKGHAVVMQEFKYINEGSLMEIRWTERKIKILLFSNETWVTCNVTMVGKRSHANNVHKNKNGPKKNWVMIRFDDNSLTNVVRNFEDEGMYLTTTKEVTKSKWAINFGYFKS